MAGEFPGPPTTHPGRLRGWGQASPPPQALLCCTGLSAVRVSRAELPRPLGSHRPELLPPAALLRPPKLAKKQQHTHSETFQHFINQILQKSLSVFREGGGAAWPGPTREAGSVGGLGAGASLRPCQPVSLGYGLCAKIKFGGTGRGTVGRAGSIPCGHQSPKSGSPQWPGEKGDPKQGLLWLQTRVWDQHQRVGAGEVGVGPGPVGLAESQPEPQDQRLWSPGPRGATGQGRRPQPRALGKLRQERTVAQWPGARGAQAGA